jgi:hypothetical protein
LLFFVSKKKKLNSCKNKRDTYEKRNANIRANKATHVTAEKRKLKIHQHQHTVLRNRQTTKKFKVSMNARVFFSSKRTSSIHTAS